MKLRSITIAFLAMAVSLPALAKNGPKDQETIVDVAIATAEALDSMEDAPFTINTIVEIVGGDPVLAAALSRRGQRTVFAPTDEAFGNLETLLNVDFCLSISDLDIATIRDVVTYHVANGRRDDESVLDSDRIRTLNGFLFQSMGVLTDAVGRESNIIATNVFADNGVIHVIDEVVLPFAPASACEE